MCCSILTGRARHPGRLAGGHDADVRRDAAPLARGTEEARRQLCEEDIMRLNGKQTIYQMIQLAERIRERGGAPREPLWYKQEYLRRLDQRIQHRLEALRTGGSAPRACWSTGRVPAGGPPSPGLPPYLARAPTRPSSNKRPPCST